jgi:hypothetical protein
MHIMIMVVVVVARLNRIVDCMAWLDTVDRLAIEREQAFIDRRVCTARDLCLPIRHSMADTCIDLDLGFTVCLHHDAGGCCLMC